MTWQRLEVDDDRRRACSRARRRASPTRCGCSAASGRSASSPARTPRSPLLVEAARRARADRAPAPGRARRTAGRWSSAARSACRSRRRSSARRCATGPAAVRLAAEAGLRAPARARRRRRRRRGCRGACAARSRSRCGADDGLDPVGRAELALLARRAADARGGARGRDAPAARRSRRCPAPAPAPGALERLGELVRDVVQRAGRGRAAVGPGADGVPVPGRRGRERSSEVQLDAAEYPGGHLDWYSFDRAGEEAPDMGARGGLSRARRCASCRRRRASPARPRRAGGRSRTRAVWFGDVGSAPEDLARVAVAWLRHDVRRRLVPRPVPAARRRDRARRRGGVLDTFGDDARHPLVRRARRTRPRVALLRADRRRLRRRRPSSRTGAARGCCCRRRSPA